MSLSKALKASRPLLMRIVHAQSQGETPTKTPKVGSAPAETLRFSSLDGWFAISMLRLYY